MALTIVNTLVGNAGSANFVTGTIAFDSSYPTSGESLTANMLGLTSIAFISIPPRLGFVFEYNYTSSLILVYTQGAAHGTGGSVTLDDYPITAGPGVTSGISISLTTGAGAATANLGPMVETLSTDDLSTVTGVRFFAAGF